MSLNGSQDIDVVYYGTSNQVNGIALDWLTGRQLTSTKEHSLLKFQIGFMYSTFHIL